METSQSTCRHVKEDGMPCRAKTRPGVDYCFFHDPDRAEERAAAREAGGRARKAAVLPEDTPRRPVKTAGDVIDLLSETINQVRTGALDPRVGNCVGYLSGIVLKAAEQGELEERLAALEATVHGHRPPEDLFDAAPGDFLPEGEREAEYAEVGP